MARLISQETFNDIVKENMNEFGMEENEAIEEATKQLESQGADLSHVIKQLNVSCDNAASEAIEKIKQSLQKQTLDEEIKLINDQLVAIKSECDKGLPYKVTVESLSCYATLIDLLDRLKNSQKLNENAYADCLKRTLETIIALMDGQPDPLNDKGIQLMLDLIKDGSDEAKLLSLQWMRVCCIMHEQNRESLFQRGVVQLVKQHFLQPNEIDKISESESKKVQYGLAMLRTFPLDDDIRVEFGNAHERAKVIAQETLPFIIELLKSQTNDEKLILEVVSALSAFLVRSDLCKTVLANQGIEHILKVLTNFTQSKKISTQALKLLKTLSGDDECKIAIIKKDGAPIIAEVFAKHFKDSKIITSSALSLVSGLSLRSPDNSEVLFTTQIPELIIEAMLKYPDQLLIQKTAAWAIRNMVSRNKNQNSRFLNLDAERLLNLAKNEFGAKAEYDFKAALSDLGCKVKLTEEWTGKGGALTTNVQIGLE